MADETWTKVAELPTRFKTYQVIVEGNGPRRDGTWAGRIVFRDGKSSRKTGQETSQPNREALEYWATGLETVYLEGAFGRSS